jgi:hypothetical protein
LCCFAQDCSLSHLANLPSSLIVGIENIRHDARWVTSGRASHQRRPRPPCPRPRESQFAALERQRRSRITGSEPPRASR